MKNIFSYLTTIIAAASILTLAGCHKNNPDDPQPAHLKVSATLDDSALSRVSIEKSDGDIDAKWQANDAISGFWKDGGTIRNLSYKVSGITADGKGADFTLTSGQEPSTEGTIVYLAYVSKELGTLAFDSDGCAQLTFITQDGSFEGLAKNLVFCAQAGVTAGKLKLKFNPSTALVDIKNIAGIGNGETIKSISVDSNTGMGGGVLRVENGNLSLCPAGKAMPVVINCTSPEGAIWFTSCPTAQPMDFVVSTVSEGDKFGDYRKRVSRPLTAGECVDVKTLSVIEGGLSGVFSVSQTSKVKFTCGNLTAHRSGGILTWGFATKQYDGASDRLVDVEADGVFQHFCWSTVETNWGMCKSISDDTARQGASKFYATYKDWSKLFTDEYRILSADEWAYILDERSDRDRFFKAVVNGTQGLVLLPDSFSWPDGISKPDGIINDKGNPSISVSYSCSEFDKFETNGAVFLPSSGIREEGQIVRVVDGMGIYRSSTYKVGTDADYTKPLLFDDGKVIIENNNGINLLDLWRGLCVRLVKDQH